VIGSAVGGDVSVFKGIEYITKFTITNIIIVVYLLMAWSGRCTLS